MMSATFFLLVLRFGAIFSLTSAAISSGVRNYGGVLTEEERKELCKPLVSGPEWVLSQKNEDYGWGDQTHRAVIVLALNNYVDLLEGSEDVLLLQNQLEVELTRALMRNATQPMLLSDLALYIHALIITGKDPRDFHGLDLVAILKGRLEDDCLRRSSEDINAFALLVLSDCRAIGTEHLNKLAEVLSSHRGGRKQKELKALALHALACAADGGEFQQYSSIMYSAAATLAKSQNHDGSFGNIYTTALIMQALVAAKYDKWNEGRAKEFLIRKRVENVNIVSTYYIERALNARKAGCLKSFYKVRPMTEDGLITVQELQRLRKDHYIQYTLRTSEHPEIYFTATVLVPKNATFFDIMRITEAEDGKFRFSWYLDESRQPAVYSISGIPNNAEESLYWRLIEQSRDDSPKEWIKSPREVYPKKGSHMIYTYADAFKPAENLY